jgi:hypothetical protein
VKNVALTLMTILGLAIMLFVGANLYYRTQLLFIAQEGAEYALNQTYLFGLRREVDASVVEANTLAHVQRQLDALGARDCKLKFSTKVQNGYPYGTLTISLPAMNIVETATAIETDSVPPYISCFALTTGGPWRGGYAQIPTFAGGPFDGTDTAEYVGSIPAPPDGTIGPGAAYLDLDISCTLLDAPHRYGLPTAGGWEY